MSHLAETRVQNGVDGGNGTAGGLRSSHQYAFCLVRHAKNRENAESRCIFTVDTQRAMGRSHRMGRGKNKCARGHRGRGDRGVGGHRGGGLHVGTAAGRMDLEVLQRTRGVVVEPAKGGTVCFVLGAPVPPQRGG